jgi:hypothetical protein
MSNEILVVKGADLYRLIKDFFGFYCPDKVKLVDEIESLYGGIEGFKEEFEGKDKLIDFVLSIKDWTIYLANDGTTSDHDNQMQDHYLYLTSPHGVENIIEDRHSPATGWDFNEEYKLIVKRGSKDQNKFNEQRIKKLNTERKELTARLAEIEKELEELK